MPAETLRRAGRCSSPLRPIGGGRATWEYRLEVIDCSAYAAGARKTA